MFIDELKSLRWTDYFLLSVTDPRALARHVSADDPKSLALSFVVPALVSLMTLLAWSLVGRQTEFFYYKITYGWALLWAALALRGVVVAGLIEVASQFAGNGPAVRETIAIVNYALFPQVFLLPVVQLTVALRFAPVYFYTFFSVVQLVVSAGLSIWSAVIIVQALAELHGGTLGRATVLFLFPVALVLFFIFISLVLGGAMLMGLAAG